PRRGTIRRAASAADGPARAGLSRPRCRAGKPGRRRVSLDFADISIRELSRHFGRRRALARVSFDCRAGDALGLLGPNGAGKSTLLAIVSTLALPSAGEVRYGGRTARELGPELRARIGVLSHDLHLYADLTARENLVFFARLYGVGDAESAVARALEHAR